MIAGPTRDEREDDMATATEHEARGHALTIESGWREVADPTLALVKRFV
jgi:hypothetical protein